MKRLWWMEDQFFPIRLKIYHYHLYFFFLYHFHFLKKCDQLSKLLTWMPRYTIRHWKEKSRHRRFLYREPFPSTPSHLGDFSSNTAATNLYQHLTFHSKADSFESNYKTREKCCYDFPFSNFPMKITDDAFCHDFRFQSSMKLPINNFRHSFRPRIVINCTRKRIIFPCQSNIKLNTSHTRPMHKTFQHHHRSGRVCLFLYFVEDYFRLKINSIITQWTILSAFGGLWIGSDDSRKFAWSHVA